jgi:methylmalonyl-CoA/ethylmalonyl-CoA epimerase
MVNLKFSHIGMAVANMDAAIASYQKIFGYTVCSGPFRDPVQKVSVCFLSRNGNSDVSIELVTPEGGDSPVNTILGKGISAYHLCYEVEDISEAIKHVRSQGCLVLGDPVGAVAFQGRRIAWFYTPTRQLTELVESSGSPLQAP